MAKEKKEKGGAPDADAKGPPKEKRDKGEKRPDAQAAAPDAAGEQSAPKP
jgi:hypothetical protein